jgi:hypothetical protein
MDMSIIRQVPIKPTAAAKRVWLSIYLPVERCDATELVTEVDKNRERKESPACQGGWLLGGRVRERSLAGDEGEGKGAAEVETSFLFISSAPCGEDLYNARDHKAGQLVVAFGCEMNIERLLNLAGAEFGPLWRCWQLAQRTRWELFLVFGDIKRTDRQLAHPIPSSRRAPPGCRSSRHQPRGPGCREAPASLWQR